PKNSNRSYRHVSVVTPVTIRRLIRRRAPDLVGASDDPIHRRSRAAGGYRILADAAVAVRAGKLLHLPGFSARNPAAMAGNVVCDSALPPAKSVAHRVIARRRARSQQAGTKCEGVRPAGNGRPEWRRRSEGARLQCTSVALAALIGGSGLGIAHQGINSADRGQAIAADVALAGPSALVGSDNRFNLAKFDDASNAAHRAAQGQDVMEPNIAPFADGASFSVTLNPPHRGHDVVATAR